MNLKNKAQSLHNLLSSVFLFFGCAGLVQGSGFSDLTLWQVRNPLPTPNQLFSIKFLNGQFVSVGENSTLISSDDGTNWTTHPVPSGITIKDVTFGNGTYVAIGDGSGGAVTMFSSDLNSWLSQEMSYTNKLSKITFGKGKFIAIGSGGKIQSSVNGADWTDHSFSETFSSIEFQNGSFVALGGQAFVSQDGESWTLLDLGKRTDVSKIFLGLGACNGRFYVIGMYNTRYFPTGFICYSQDGLSWSEPVVPNFISYTPVVYQLKTQTIITASRYNVIAEDGENFTLVDKGNTPENYNVSSFVYGSGIVVGVGRTILNSTTGTNWSQVAAGYNPDLSDIAYGVNCLIGTDANSGSLLVSSNGLPFVKVNSPVSVGLSRAVFVNGCFYCVGNNGVLLRSQNGVNWSQVNSAITSDLRGISYGNGVFVVVGNNGAISTSPNGLAWTQRFSGTSVGLKAVFYSGDGFVAVGDLGTVLTSKDGTAWEAQYSGVISTLNDVSFGNGRFVAVGGDGIVILSNDGVNWSPEVSRTTNNLISVEFADGIFLAVSADGILSSTDGMNWEKRDTGMAFLNRCRYLNGSLWCVGQGGRIYQNSSIKSLELSCRQNSKNQKAEVIVKGALGQSFDIQACSNLGAAQWNPYVSITNAPNPLVITNQLDTSESMRFYRVLGK